MCSNLPKDFLLSVNTAAFVPLQTITDRAQELVERKRGEIARLEPTDPLRPGQEMHLKLMESKGTADVEYLLATSVNDAVTDTGRPHLTLNPILSRPWSRGTVV